jgi:DNA-binding winged helix-turn-helix (wHTH) protein
MTNQEIDKLAECVNNMRLLPNTLQRYVGDCLWYFLQRTGHTIEEEKFLQKCLNSKSKPFQKKVVRRRKEK